MDGVLYCKPHFEQLFKESGNYSKNFQTGPSLSLSVLFCFTLFQNPHFYDLHVLMIIHITTSGKSEKANEHLVMNIQFSKIPLLFPKNVFVSHLILTFFN